MNELDKYRKLQEQRKKAYTKYALTEKGKKARKKAMEDYHQRIKRDNRHEGFRKNASPAEKAYEGRDEIN